MEVKKLIYSIKIIRVIFFALGVFSLSSFAAITPYITLVDNLSFGEILGLPGSCYLAHDTKEVIDSAGSLCPAQESEGGTPGKFILYANANKQVNIKIKNKINDGDGLSFTADGVYSVSGLPDITILPNQFQLIDTGSTGIIIITIGGTLTSSIQQNFSSSYNLNVIDGIEFFEL
jgi:hypothetical protein